MADYDYLLVYINEKVAARVKIRLGQNEKFDLIDRIFQQNPGVYHAGVTSPDGKAFHHAFRRADDETIVVRDGGHGVGPFVLRRKMWARPEEEHTLFSPGQNVIHARAVALAFVEKFGVDMGFLK